MDESSVLLVREALLIMLRISAPILAAGVCVGLIISIIQSVTSIQDQTLTFVPKIFAMVLVAVVLVPWIGRCLVEFAAAMLTLM